MIKVAIESIMNHSFWRLFFSQATTNVGDVLYIVSLITVIYSSNQSVLLLSMLPFTITICQFFCGLFSPIVIDRFQLKLLLLMSQGLKVLLFLFLIWVLSGESIYFSVVFSIVALIAIADGIQQPVTFSLIPSIVPEAQLLRANSIFSISFQTTDLLTWSVGAVVVAMFGYQLAIGLTLTLYVVSFIILFFVHVQKSVEIEQIEDSTTIWNSLTEGWRIITKDVVLSKFLWISIIRGMSYPIWVAAVLYVFVDQVLHMNESWWGYLNSIRIVGSLIGGIVIYKIAVNMQGNYVQFLLFATATTAILSIMFGFNTVPILALIFVFMLGFPEQMEVVIQTTMTQERVKENLLAKVYTAQNVIYYLVFSISVLCIGWLVDLFHVQIIFICASILLFVNVLFVYKMKHL
ncbi:MAG TPA: MFS transporter [Bacillota bacterium]|nr:MFS transporter [Bacillota bacterium]